MIGSFLAYEPSLFPAGLCGILRELLVGVDGKKVEEVEEVLRGRVRGLGEVGGALGISSPSGL